LVGGSALGASSFSSDEPGSGRNPAGSIGGTATGSLVVIFAVSEIWFNELSKEPHRIALTFTIPSGRGIPLFFRPWLNERLM